MKVILILIALMSTAFAQSNFMDKREVERTLDYLDSICGDTYCGGDIGFNPHDMSCSGGTCTVEFSAGGYSDFNRERSAAAVGQTRASRFVKDVTITFNEIEIVDTDEDGFQEAGMSFTCKLNNLWTNMAEYDSKVEMIYDMVVFGCVRELEATVYAREVN